MAMGSSNQVEDAAPYINVTPLIDVLLVLLIIFMVISPLKPSRFEAKIPSEPDPNQQQDVKPNPNTLVVTLDNSTRKLKLNNDEIGTLDDPSSLGSRLSEIFQQRTANGVYRENSNPPEIEKTVFVKAPKATKYGDVVKVIDSIKGSGAEPVGLQIDDLPQ